MTSKTIIVGLVALAFVTCSIMTVSVAYAATQGQPFQALDNRITTLEEDNAQSNSFFDVFFDVYTVDSFFDIFTELQTNDQSQQSQIDSFFDIFTELQAADSQLQSNIDNEAAARQASDTQLQNNIDSFFDVFTEISVHEEDISRIDTELVALDLRGQSCEVGDVVTGIDVDGNLVCATDQTGSGGGSSGQLIVVQRPGPTTQFSPDFPFRSSFAPCLSGEMVVGGGYRTLDVTVNITSESMEHAGGDILGWYVNAYSPSGTGSITAIAECATITP